MTPTQLRAYVAVVRLGSIKQAAEELEVSESAVSFNVAQLRKELGDPLFTRHATGLAFTPGGLRLASRGAEMLGLQDRTITEVAQAGRGRRLLRLAASSLFGEYAAPGLIELFAGRAADLDVELSLQPPTRFVELLLSRTVDVAIGPRPQWLPEEIAANAFLKYQLVLVAAPDHPLVGAQPSLTMLREQTWYLGPSAATELGLVPAVLRGVGVPEDRQQIFQSHAAAAEEAKRGGGVAPVLGFAVSKDLASGALRRVDTPALSASAVWSVLRLSASRDEPSDELARFVTTPRAMQAMIRGSGVTIGRFQPSIHVTLWR